MTYKISHRLASVLVLLTLLIATLPAAAVQAAGPVVHAVFFYSPNCGHCHEVMEKHLPPLKAQYGEQLNIVGIDVEHEVGSALYQATLNVFNVPDNRIGVPTLVVGEMVLVGSVEIPEQFPDIVAAGLAAGGIGWPNIPGLEMVIGAQSTTIVQETAAPQDEGPIFLQRFLQDPLANSIAVVLLILMLMVVVYVLVQYLRGVSGPLLDWPRLTIPILAVLGMGVALYMTYIEITASEAICGPVGNCNSVQESKYAFLFGIIPIGLMGLVGYVAILATWAGREYGPQSLHKPATLALWGMGWFGILFSIYLTFLEPFVIGATCAWCVASAIIMTLTFMAATGPAIRALQVEYDDEED